jgi:glycosyltransferase involved in cell wall biosynthesis
MKIAFVYRTRASGVEAVHIRGIADALVRIGHEVSYFGPVMSPEQTASTAGRQTRLASCLQGLAAAMPEIVFELLELLYALPAVSALVKRRHSFRYNLIYERYAIFGFAGTLAARIFRVPVILEINYTSLSPLVRKRSSLLRPLARAIDRWTFRRATALIAVSSWLRDELIREFDISTDRIVVLPNAADPDLFRVQPKTGRSMRFTVGFVGAFFPWHGVDLLVRAVASLKARGLDVEVHLIGDGPEKANIARLVAELGLNDAFVFFGRVRHNDLPEYIREFDVGVMPDSNVYGSPMKIFEYLALGRPVIAPDYSPILDAYEDGKQGYIFRRHDHLALAECIARAMASPAQLATMGVAARELVVRERNWMNNTVMSLRAAGIHQCQDIQSAT